MNNKILLLNFLKNESHSEYLTLCDIFDNNKDKIVFGKKLRGRIYKKRFSGETIFGIELIIKK